MNKSELIERVAALHSHLSARDVKLAVNAMLGHMSDTLADGGRIEVRGFGSFSLRRRGPRLGRNPRTGERIHLAGKYVPYFKPGKEMRERVNESRQQEQGPEPGSGRNIFRF